MSRQVFALFALAGLLSPCVSSAIAQQAAPAQNAVPQQPAIDPRLMQVLREWHASSDQVKKLEGEHMRFTFDYVFNTERRAEGRFYYERPDRGRIDLQPTRVAADLINEKKNPLTNQPVKLSVQADRPERWICDGAQILVIDDEQKTIQQYPIPPEDRGANIMDGPLPFLFGLPPEKALARYDLRLYALTEKEVDLVVIPKTAMDAANYKWARVRIERATMLPMAVQMVDPAGTKETVYTFPRIEKNPAPNRLIGLLPFFKDKDPFKPELKGYDLHAATEAPEDHPVARNQKPVPGPAPAPGNNPAQPAAPIPGRGAVPSVVGFEFKAAQTLLERAGYQVKFLQGEAAVTDQLKYRVQAQKPAPLAALAPGETVWVTLYGPPIQQTGAVVEKAGGRVPDVTGRHWKDAEKVIAAAGYEVKLRQGTVATRADDIFKVVEQSPAAGTPLAPGQPIVLTLLTRPTAGQ